MRGGDGWGGGRVCVWVHVFALCSLCGSLPYPQPFGCLSLCACSFFLGGGGGGGCVWLAVFGAGCGRGCVPLPVLVWVLVS